MEKFQEALSLAAKKVQVADHLLNQTYPLINDPKLLLGIMETMNDAVQLAITGILEHDLLWKRITPYNASSKAITFCQKIIPKYDLPKQYADLVLDLQETINEHKKASVEFIRRSQFVISDDTYTLRTLSVDKTKAYLTQVKQFVRDIQTLVEKNDRITR
ncbi:MAG: hypothetical protein V1725_02825 [archaeon]